jgi:uncharacterized protein YndB with AHSA1/START domain
MSTTTTTTDRIEKRIVLRAPRARVWRALTTPDEFGAWFGAKVAGPFAAGARIRGPLTHQGYEHLTMDFTIERIEPERLVSWRWHPHGIDPAVDYTAEPTTLVTFELQDTPEGTLLTVVESGFDGIPIARRAEAFRSNDGGWAAQMENIQRHVGQPA